jgi:biotin carboxylase
VTADGRTLLVVSGGAEAVPGIERVKRLGVRVAVSDGSADAPGLALADERLVVSTYDADGTVAAARDLASRCELAGVMAIAADVPWTVASVAAALGLPGIPLEAARMATDKLAMKRCFAEAGVPVPLFAEVESADDLAHARSEHDGPLVVKPVDSRGARGVQILGGETDLAAAFEIARAASPTERVMVEAFVPGPQLSTESVILGDEVVTLGCSDRNYARLAEFAPHVIEDGGCQPTEYLDEVLPPIDEVIGAAARALGIERGTLKGDVVLDPALGPVLIEVAPRLSGGWFCTDQIPYSTGVDLVQVAARLALGDDVTAAEVAPRSFHPVAVRYAFPPEGRVRAIHGVDEVRARPEVLRLELFAGHGNVIGPVTDHTRRAAVVLATGPSRAEAVANARDAVAAIRFELAAG